MAISTQTIQLNYGQSHWEQTFDSERVIEVCNAPASIEDISTEIQAALNSPLEYPPLEQAVVEGDKIILAFDPETPQCEILIKEIWDVLNRRGVQASDITLLQPTVTNPKDPRIGLSSEVAEEVVWKIHDSKDEDASGYLASTTNGQRVYLAKELLESDYIVTLGTVGFDSRLGFHGTHSVLFPGLSNGEAGKLFIQNGHEELTPENDRPLRQMVDEIGWLLGVQFTIQVVPGSQGGIAKVMSGSNDAVLRAGKEFLNESSHLELDSRVDVVLASATLENAVDQWEAFARAISNAKSLVARDGRLILLTDLKAEPTQALKMLMEEEFPQDALMDLRKAGTLEAQIAAEMAEVTAWCRVYLLSQLDPDTVEELFFIPVASHQELERLLETVDSCLFAEEIQSLHGRVNSY